MRSSELATPVDVCAVDTTEVFNQQRSTTPREASTSTSAHSPLLGVFDVSGGTFERQKVPRPRVLGGSVPAPKLALVAAMSLAAVAVVATLAGRRTARLARIATGGAAEDRHRHHHRHPRRTQLEGPVLTSPHTGVALHGVDVVAFRFLNEGDDPVFGNSEYSLALETTDVDGGSFVTTFLFSSSMNRDLFKSNPAYYAPRFGGFCSYGITSEYAAGWNVSMNSAEVTQGWPWSRDHLGPPASLRVWAIRNNSLYFAFLQPVMDAFLDDYDALATAGEARWTEWFGDQPDRKTLAGPFNVQCMASSYGPPVVRTCTYEPQDFYNNQLSSFSSDDNKPHLSSSSSSTSGIEESCVALLEDTCGDFQGDNPVRDDACSHCLEANFELLATACPASDGGLHSIVDKTFCW